MDLEPYKEIDLATHRLSVINKKEFWKALTTAMEIRLGWSNFQIELSFDGKRLRKIEVWKPKRKISQKKLS
jgi:hypothetical protein